MKLKIITPSRTVFIGEVESLTAKGVNGYFQILNDHSPIVAVLEKGPLKFRVMDPSISQSNKLINKVEGDSLSFEYINTKGGVLEVKENTIVVLSE